MSPLSKTAHRRLYVLVGAIVSLQVYLASSYTHFSPDRLHLPHASQSHSSPEQDNAPAYSINGQIPPDCPPLPGLDNIVLVLKTGVTESATKLPIHRNTTLRCIPNYIVWSDYDENIADIPVHDVLYNESSSLHQLPDFNLYTRVQEQGRDALTSHDLSGVREESTAFGKSNPGWKLDKWKFVPMISHTLKQFHSPQNKWYVFVEADTYILLPNLLSWLGRLDASRPWYLGNQMQIRDILFAHGGSGFILSRPAIEAANGIILDKRGYWDAITQSEWAGDCVLGILLGQAGVELTWSWPMLQLAPPKEIEFFGMNYGRRMWCFPAVSFHHLEPGEIRELVRVERGIVGQRGRADEPITWRDIFLNLARPAMVSDEDGDGVRRDWDNGASEDKGVTLSVQDCRDLCAADRYCLQFVRRADGTCLFGRDARVGGHAPGAESGWLTERIDKAAKMLGSCPRVDWG
ncbi:uncharacterized protein DSM5745_07875 [Aspergillus mulundensis]|uniref:N-acetylgalactosaminide beta-1,3-galactosyltransferase n=1 Tax=Aspergillus mulundensis TaxID=1810919 RepID=A0A3D8RF80_9EURO|nr:Uncharacterized protein DSM5745_07875 [Aspergillus mulundensis]RDW72703.1 Uncharacterized protein DSM5745_07875 [Aspergillus mulundensis]